MTPDAAALPVAPSVREAVGAEWADLAAPGTWLTGAQRVAAARAARAARAGQGHATYDEPLLAAAARLAAAPAEVTEQWVDGLGLEPQAYVEVLGVVARLVAVDTALRGLGAAELALPSPRPGAPSRQRVADARRRSAWVPTVGPASPSRVLSAVAAEHAGQARLHAALYLAYDEMSDLTITKHGLSRVQMELAAARTSLLNDCFY